MQSPIDEGVVLITGASSGIGREIARIVAGRAKALVLVARRLDRLEELKDELTKAHPKLEVVAVACDLSEAGSWKSLVDTVRGRLDHVDVLVNNAGVGDMGVYDLTDPERIEKMITLNVMSLALLTRALVAPMVARGRGGVLNLSSGFGLGFLPGFTAYIGTKFFVTGFTEALRADLAGTGVRATQVCPGPVATEFEQNIGNFTGHKPPAFIEISAARCARAAVRAFDRGRAMVVPGFVIAFVLWMNRYAPRFVLRAIASAFGPPLRRRQVAKITA